MKTTLPKDKYQTRVEIAKDVLKHLKRRKFTASLGKYTEIDGEIKFDKSLSAQKIVKNAKVCNVCAKGAITLAWVEKFNNANASIFSASDTEISSMPKDMVEIFGQPLLDALETAYEGKAYSTTAHSIPLAFENYFPNCSRFNKDTDEITRTEKIEALMNNIIRNKGFLKLHGYVIG